MLLMHGDCLERMKEIPDSSVDMILTDPPYGTVRSMMYREMKESNSTHAWDCCVDHKLMLSECNRVLRANGALLLFGQDPYTGKLMNETHGNMPFSYRLTWLKDKYGHALLSKKAPLNYTEDICVFFKKYETVNQHPLRDFARCVFEHIGKPKRAIFSEMGNQGTCHFFRFDTDQFNLCTENTYSDLIEMYGIDRLDIFKPYEELAAIDAGFKESVRRIFNLP